MKFLDGMFRIRGYCMESKEIAYVKSKKLWNIFIRDQDGHKVLCILTGICCNHEDSIGAEEYIPPDTDTHDTTTTEHNNNNDTFKGSSIGTSKTKRRNIGTEFIKSIMVHGEQYGVHMVILVTDLITSHALKVMNNSHLRIVHFTYAETSILHMAQHINQPVLFRKLTGEETKEYVLMHKNFFQQLPRYAVTDPLIKYFGFQVGDIIEYEDNDGQSGLYREHGVIVQDLT